MAAHRELWHKGLQHCALLTRKLGLGSEEPAHLHTRSADRLLEVGQALLFILRQSPNREVGGGATALVPLKTGATDCSVVVVLKPGGLHPLLAGADGYTD